jgi:hypothetical protein
MSMVVSHSESAKEVEAKSNEASIIDLRIFIYPFLTAFFSIFKSVKNINEFINTFKDGVNAY